APAEAWRWSLDTLSEEPRQQANAVVRDGAGQIIAAGAVSTTDSSDFTVVKLDAATGTEIWRSSIDGTSAGPVNLVAHRDEAVAVTVDPDDDVIAVGNLVNETTGDDGFVVKLAGTTGTELWRRELHDAHVLGRNARGRGRRGR